MSMNARRINKRLATLNQEQIAYINGCNILQRAVWRITHEDPLFCFRSQIKRYILREAVLILINLRERSNRAILKLTILKWLQKAQNVAKNNERLRALLKIIFLNNESKNKNAMTKYLHKWAAKASMSESEILKKYGYLFKFLDLLKNAALFPAKKQFFDNLKKFENPEYFKKPLRNIVKVYNRNLLNQLKRAFNKWRLNARDGELNELKKKVLINTIISTIRNRDRQALLKALRTWHNNALTERLCDDFDEADFFNRMRTLVALYGKYNKINRLNKLNLLSKAFAKWRLNTIEKGEPLESRILKAKEHMLKHNINQNAEDLLNALRDVSEIKRLETLLRKFVLRAPKYNHPILRRALRKWRDNTKELNNRDLIRSLQLRYVTDKIDRNRKDRLKELLRKAFQTWRRNTTGPKTALPDTEKAIYLLRKATVQPFFQKMRENIIKDMNNQRFRGLIAAYFRKSDKDLLHWWLGQWRRNALNLKIYELKALLLKHLYDDKVRNAQLKAIRDLKEKLNNYEFKEILKSTILANHITSINRINDEINKRKLTRALFLWRSKLEKKKEPNLENYDEGSKFLQRFCWRQTHPDVLDAFDFKITIPAIDKLLRKIIINKNKKDVRDTLLKNLYKWRMHCAKPEENIEQKMKYMFEEYLENEPIRKKRFSMYKEIVKVLKQCRENKEDAAKKIADYLRGIKEIPDQIRNLRISKYLMRLMNIYSNNDYLRLRSALNEWARRARNVKADEDARVIQKFIRDKLAKRLKKRAILEKAVEHTKTYIKMRIFDIITDYANKNRIPDILLKYYLRKNAEDMKLLREKFNHWRNLLPYMRNEDAASLIQAAIKGYLLRKDFKRFNRLSEILYKIIEKMMEKDYIGPALKKWQKNARLLKCHEDARTIQDFCRKNLRKRIKNKAKKEMQILYKKYIYKLIAEMLKTKKINPQDVEKLYHTLKRVAVREPFYKLLEGLRWKIIIKNLKNVPKIYDRNRKEILRKYL